MAWVLVVYMMYHTTPVFTVEFTSLAQCEKGAEQIKRDIQRKGFDFKHSCIER